MKEHVVICKQDPSGEVLSIQQSTSSSPDLTQKLVEQKKRKLIRNQQELAGKSEAAPDIGGIKGPRMPDIRSAS